MAVEAERGCGFRKAGGLYLVSEGIGEPCERLPIPLVCCPTCGEGVRQTRSFRWIKPELIFAGAKPCAMSTDKDLGPAAQRFRAHCPRCFVCTPGLLETMAQPSDRVALLWVGEAHYKEAQDWTREAMKLGVSKRIGAAIPKDLVLGKTIVFVAHPKAIAKTVQKTPAGGELVGKEEVEHTSGIFHAFIPRRAELVVTPSMKKEKWVEELVKQGATLVEVPEDDHDHAPAVGKKSARKRAMDRAARKAEKAKKEDGADGDGKGKEGEEAA